MPMCSGSVGVHVELEGEVQLGVEFLRVGFVVFVTLKGRGAQLVIVSNEVDDLGSNVP